MSQPSAKGYAAVDGMEPYWESSGSGGTPPIVVHGGFGLISMFGELSMSWPSADGSSRYSCRAMATRVTSTDPSATRPSVTTWPGVTEQLGLERVDLLGYSLGAGCSLRAAIQHPDRVRRAGRGLDALPP